MSSDFLASLASNVWAIFLVVLFFGGSIFVHELGHFLAARRRGVHVERFSIGFGPAIWSWRGKDGVEYRIAWFPLGGYVLLPQLADLGPIEGESVADVAKLPPVSYLTKMIVFVAGATFNVLFAFALACIVWVVGQPIPAVLNTTQIGHLSPTVKLANGTAAPNPAVEAGLQAGDVIVSIDGRAVENFEEIAAAVFLGKKRSDDGRRKTTFVIERAGRPMEFIIYPVIAGQESSRTAGIEPAEDLTIGSLVEGSPAALAGLLPGDRFIGMEGQLVHQRNVVVDYINQHANVPVAFTIRRGTESVEVTVKPRAEVVDKASKKEVGRIGIVFRTNFIVTHPTPFAQLTQVVTRTFQILDGLISRSSDVKPSQLSGPLGIMSEMKRQAQWDIRGVLGFTILLNVSLAIFNLLPIPVLDGGQMVFATIARLRGRPLPVNFIVATQGVFMVLFLMLFVYVTVYGDLRRERADRAERAEAAAAPRPLPAAPAPAGAPPGK